MQHQSLSNTEIFIAEVTGGSFVAHALSAVNHLPSWVTGGLSAVVIGCMLRVLDPTLRALGEKLQKRMLQAVKPPTDDGGPDDPI